MYPLLLRVQIFRVHPKGRREKKSTGCSLQRPNGSLPPALLVLPGGDQGEVDIELLEEQLAEGRPVADVDPVASRRVLLLALALARDDVVVALRARDGARQPNLLVGGLLVDNVGADLWEGGVEDSGLCVCGKLVGQWLARGAFFGSK